MYFTDSHEWIKVEDGLGTVGVTTHAKNAKAAQAFLDYVTSPMADKVYVSFGMQPLK